MAKRSPEKPNKIKIPWNLWGPRAVLGLGWMAILTGCLTGSLGFSSASWQEGRICPYTIYAPFSFSVHEQEKPVQVERGELIVAKGERLNASQVARLNALHQLQRAEKSRLEWVGAFLLVGLFTAIGAIYLMRYERRIWQTPRQLALIAVVSALVLGLTRLISQSPLANPWVPVAGVPMLISMLLNPRLGIVTGLLMTGLVGLMGQADLPLVTGLAVGCFVGAYSVRRIRRRIHFFRAGLWTGLAQGTAILAGYCLLEWAISASLTQALAGLGGGIFSSLITFCLLPICESLFGLITDITLLEFSDLNHPLLKELSVKAPGTYHHSLIVATLAEAACEAVGANALLARVGSYFHDIGKMLHPEYFVENQRPQNSPHDRLTPSLSSLVILNHVKDGVELGRRHRLNQAIIDFIPGHHGTGLIYYFYRRALEEVEDETQLKEERYRYPGPKPHGRETAVVLLSDSVEAATRALTDKSTPHMEEVVRRIVNNKFIDGQLDECDLTLKDLNRIAEAFLRELSGIYHGRVEYPKPPHEEGAGEGERRQRVL